MILLRLPSPHFVRIISCALQVGLALLVAGVNSSRAATLPSGFTESNIGGGMASLTAMTVLNDGRVLVCQQDGYVRVVKNGKVLPTPFATMSVVRNGDSGLFGITTDPNFASNGYVYVYYTTDTPTLHNRVTRFTADPANLDVALPGSETLILKLDNLVDTGFHSGGAMRFGPDGKLYIAVGDNDNGKFANAQSMTTLHGKLLRINPVPANADGTSPAATFPTDNPFYSTTTGKNRAIWALGFRNPFTMEIQRGTGKLFVADVGNNRWEEIDEVVKGGNYGWPHCEGDCSPANASYKQPLYSYSHGSGNDYGCCIIGTAAYNPVTNRFPSKYFGKIFFSDHCNGWIKTLDPATGAVEVFATGVAYNVAIEVGADGYLYYLPKGSYGVFRVSYTGQLSPQITQQPQSQAVAAGQSATFTVSASGEAPLGYQWQRNTANIAGATSASYTLSSATGSDNGAQFRCVVSNAYGSVTSDSATLSVSQDQPPVGTIDTPVAGTRYNAGNTISYSGRGTDFEDGQLPPSAHTWWIDLHHGDHVHDFTSAASGFTSGSFVVPDSGETAADVFYRIYLHVVDSDGYFHTTYRDVVPNTATVTIDTNPPSLSVLLDGQPIATPLSELGVVGMRRNLGVISPQTVGGTTYVFSSWSDGGAAAHEITTPATNTTFTAHYVVAQPPTITQHPARAAVPLDKTGTFRVSASGTGTLRYQWQRNGADITGANSAEYTTPPVKATDHGAQFRCVVSSDGGSVTSNSARLDAMVTLRQYTSPPGLKMLIDGGGSNPGVPITTPWAFYSVIGAPHTFSAVSPQTVGGVTYEFDSWSLETSTALTQELQVTTPDTNRYYTAVYRAKGGVQGTGTGLLGKYSDNVDFTGAFVRRTDANINFNWRGGSPVDGIGADTFSVRWTGMIQAPVSQWYTFYTSSDDGVRLVVDGKTLINDWTIHAEQERTSTRIWLTAGKKYPIRLDYFDNTGGAAVRLYWSGKSIPKSLVPASQLYPD